MEMSGTYDRPLVLLSVLIAIAASFTALDVANRIRASRGWTRRVWLSAAAVALGGGIWAMHFVAMLAFSMPGVRMDFDLGLTALSLGLAIAFTAAGFAIVGWRGGFRGRTAVAGLLMGLGVVAMHYVGMAAMRMPATLRYERVWVAISVLIAIGAAIAAVWLASRDQTASHRLAAATIMGAAISGMHYAGMRAAVFIAAPNTANDNGPTRFGHTELAVAIAGVTLVILMLALGAAWLERLFAISARREARIALRLKVADILRGGGTMEALNEVAALMGEHFEASRTGYAQLDPVEDMFSYDVCWTDGTAAPLLGQFPAAAFGVKIVAALSAGKTVAVEDLFNAELSDEARTRKTARDVDTRAVLVVPFVRDGQLRSIVYLNDRSPRRWHPEDIAFMEELAERTRLVIERDAVEARLRELNATLEARVEARTAELRVTQEALLQSQKMEAVGQLVSGLAHDFNNVLGAVVGAFELIGRSSDDPGRIKRFTAAGLQAAQRGSRLTAQLLTFSRSRSIELQPIYVCDVIEALREFLKRTLGPMVALDLKLNPAPVAVLADPTQVEMMVLNLAINARDAMPQGGTLSIRTTIQRLNGDTELPDGDYVVVTAADTGTGMDEVTLRRAMEPFFTTKPVGKGTGLGLSQVYGSARQSGGTVRIESNPGAGTTVRVYLPCTDRQPIRLAAVADASADNDLDQRLRVLVVDDDHDHRSMLANALEMVGHTVLQAPDGASALSALEVERPDILIMDFAMPGMNGAEVAGQARRRWPDLPLVFVSGFADIDAIYQIDGDEAAFLRKPFLISELLEAIKLVSRSPASLRAH